MASNVEIDLIKQLVRITDNSLEREFLEIEARKFRRFNSKNGEPIEDQVVKARRDIQDLVTEDIGNHPLIPKSLRENERTMERGRHLHGEEFVGNLLPANYRQFGSVINLLRNQNIETRRQLIALPDVGSLTGVGKERALLIKAMQKLAILEFIQAPQKGKK